MKFESLNKYIDQKIEDGQLIAIVGGDCATGSGSETRNINTPQEYTISWSGDTTGKDENGDPWTDYHNGANDASSADPCKTTTIRSTRDSLSIQ